jgi:sulfite exporter TauE/SafE
MTELFIAFVTGLTTGGLSCLAVQGGLLASSIAREVEEEIHSRPKKRGDRPVIAGASRAWMSILLFLGAKLTAYTILGFILGWAGSMIQLSPTAQALLFLAIGVFMIGNALRMLEVHPVFRYFAIQPPRFLTRFIRRAVKNGDSFATPLFLGALTVLIPCGVTQAIMAAAMASGNPPQAAAMLFAFTLGTSPVFFTVAYLATRLGARLEAWFLRLTAVVILALGLFSIRSGLTLAGSPPAAWFRPAAATPSAPGSDLILTALNDGYSPGLLYAVADAPVTLTVVTENNRSCSRAFVIPSLQIQKLLPETGRVRIDLPAQSAGAEIYFSCSMGMYNGWIVFVENGAP